MIVKLNSFVRRRKRKFVEEQELFKLHQGGRRCWLLRFRDPYSVISGNFVLTAFDSCCLVVFTLSQRGCYVGNGSVLFLFCAIERRPLLLTIRAIYQWPFPSVITILECEKSFSS